MIRLLFVFIGLPSFIFAQTGPYSPAVGQTGSNAVSANSNACVAWASEVEVTRAPINLSQPGAPLADAGESSFALGKADGACISLGDGGVATLSFNQPLQDLPGYDFAVFENGFYSPIDSGYFLELAIVEVSSNGMDFVMFPAHSLTPSNEQVGSFGTVDPTQVNGLAGKYETGYGTPFDLAELAGYPELDIFNVTHVRITDVVGSIDSTFGTADTAGNMINDPWPTAFSSCGFDLDAVCALNEALESSDVRTSNTSRIQTIWDESFSIYTTSELEYTLHDALGKEVGTGQISKGNSTKNVSHLSRGIYFLRVNGGHGQQVYKCIKR